MKLLEALKRFLQPHKVVTDQIKEITVSYQEQARLTQENKRRIKDMMAVLNGEEDWFLERKGGQRIGERRHLNHGMGK